MKQVLADLALARRLELTEGHGNAAFVDAQARLDPSASPLWTNIGGTFAMFAGVGSPITQTFGLGMHQPLVEKELDAIERFFTSRGSAVFHEVCPLAGVEVLQALAARGYRPIELSSVLYQPIDANTSIAANPDLHVRQVERHESELYATIASRGWSEHPEAMPYIKGFAKLSLVCASCFVAEKDGRPIATAALFMHGGVALLAGASTVPEGRRQGAQNALLDARLRTAASAGCDLAMMVAAPGSASQRNAERQGFRIAYTRTKWQRDA
ncbi:MAG TPA: GNAT family N-acetyltransferase [Vicinamibacterales bacterium]|nr:GNAT family N-acetyltransferase [Vicinamibacterales bacterium]